MEMARWRAIARYGQSFNIQMRGVSYETISVREKERRVPENLQGRNFACKPFTGHVCDEEWGRIEPDWHLGEQESGQQRCPPSYHKTVAGDISFE